MLKSFHLGHVRKARVEAFSRMQRQSKMKVVQASKTRAKEYSVAIVSPQNIEMR